MSKNKQPSNIQISPDGKYLGYTTEDNEGRLQLRVRTIGQQDDRLIASSKNKRISHYQWSYLPGTLLYKQNTGGKNEHFYAFNVATNMRRCLTPFVAQDAAVSPQLIGISPCNRSEILVALNLDNPDVHDVYRLDLLTGALVLDTKNPGNVESWTADIGLNIRAATIVKEDGSREIQYRNYHNRTFGEWKTVISAPAGNNCSVITVSALSGKLYFLSNAENLRLSAFDLQTEQEVVIYDDTQNQLITIEINPVTFEIDALLLRKQKPNVLFLSEELKGDYSRLETIRGRKSSVLSRSLANDLWIVVSRTKQGKARYALFDTKSNQLTTL